MRTLFSVALAATLLAACSQRVSTEEEFASQERERPIVSAEGARLPVVAGAPAGGMGGSASPASTGAPATAEDRAQTIRGTIEAPAAPGSGVLFLFVRAVGVTGGPPLAVQRIPSPSFPREFSIGPQDAMIAGGPFPARVSLEARLDADGNAMTEGPEDLSARAEVEPGATGVTLTLAAPGA